MLGGQNAKGMKGAFQAKPFPGAKVPGDPGRVMAMGMCLGLL